LKTNNTTLTAISLSSKPDRNRQFVAEPEIAKRQPQRAPESKFMLKDSPCYIGMGAKGEVALQAQSERANQAALASVIDGELNDISMENG